MPVINYKKLKRAQDASAPAAPAGGAAAGFASASDIALEESATTRRADDGATEEGDDREGARRSDGDGDVTRSDAIAETSVRESALGHLGATERSPSRRRV